MADPAVPSVDDLIAQLNAQRSTTAPPSPTAAPDLGLAAGVPVAPPAGPSAEDLIRQAALTNADTTTGAPVGVRAVVGAAPPGDRLKTLQQYFPDAEALPGTNNFVFTGPGGKRQTYMPIGWRAPTMGDYASIGPEIAEGVGGTGGAILGSGAGPVGTAVGGGLGAAAGKEGYQDLMRFLGMQDTRTLPQQFGDVATTAGINAVLPPAFERFVAPPVTSLLRPTPPTATATAAKALDDAGVTTGLAKGLPASVAAESPGASKIEQTILSMPFTGGVREAYGGTRDTLASGVDTATTRAAAGQPVPPPATFATTVGDIATDAGNRFLVARQAADDTAMRLIGADRPVDLQPLRDLRAQLQTQLNAAPASLAPRYTQALDQIDKVLGDATASGSPALPSGAGTLPFSAVRNIRTDVGKTIDWTQSSLGGPSPTGVPALQQVYGALKDSLTGAAHDAGPNAEAALAAHDSMVTAYNAPGGPRETFEALADPARRADQLTKMMQSTAPADQQSLVHLMDNATPVQRQQLTGGVIQQMGYNPADVDAGFDMGRWFNNYKRMTDGAKDTVFGAGGAQGGLRADLDNLATVQRTMSESAANKNFSNSAPTYAIVAALSALTGALAHGELGAAIGAVAPTAGPSLAGRLMTSRPFVKWLTGTWGVNGADPAQWAAHLGRLAAVGEADPDVAGLVTQLRSQLPDQLPQPGAPATLAPGGNPIPGL